MATTENSQTGKNKGLAGMIIVAALLFAAGFFIGSLYQENQQLKKGVTAPTVAVDQPTQPQGPTAETLAALPAVSDEDYLRGDENADIVLVEYSDYECPFCNRFHPTTKQILEEFSNVALVYRHYPLPFHPLAQTAAETAECVGKVGGNDAFWAYTDALFAAAEETGGTLSQEMLDAAVSESGANTSEVAACVEAGEMKEKVTAQSTAGGAAGISGTPGTVIVVRGEPKELIPGALPFDQVKTMIEKYL